ncbi:hypothetical protein MRY87_02505 [bacterium]|nr:hypothetical protein [bacterium]
MACIHSAQPQPDPIVVDDLRIHLDGTNLSLRRFPSESVARVCLDEDQARQLAGALRLLKPATDTPSTDLKSTDFSCKLQGNQLTLRKLEIDLTLDLSRTDTTPEELGRSLKALCARPEALSEDALRLEDYRFQRSRGARVVQIGEMFAARSEVEELFRGALRDPALQDEAELLRERVSRAELCEGITALWGVFNAFAAIAALRQSNENELVGWEPLELDEKGLALREDRAERAFFKKHGILPHECELTLDTQRLALLYCTLALSALNEETDLEASLCTMVIAQVLPDEDGDTPFYSEPLINIAGEERAHSLQELLSKREHLELESLRGAVEQFVKDFPDMIGEDASWLEKVGAYMKSTEETLFSALLSIVESREEDSSPILSEEAVVDSAKALYKRACEELQTNNYQVQRVIAEKLVEKYGSPEEAKAEIREKMTGSRALLKGGKKAGFGMMKAAGQERLDREQYYLRCLRAVWPD